MMTYKTFLLKLIVFLTLLSSNTLFAQLTKKSQFKEFSKELKFPFKESDDPKQKYPRLNVEDGETIVQLVKLNGIKVSYIVDYDKWEEFEVSTVDKEEDWYIDFILENNSGTDLYYDNANDIVAYMKMPGEKTYYDDLNGKELNHWGGYLPFFAWMLEDKKNGKYILRNNDSYEWDYLISRDAEAYIEAMVQRRFRPMEVSVSVPNNKKEALGKMNDLIAYDQTVSLSAIKTSTNGNYHTSTVELPRKRIYLTSAYPKIESTHNFKQNGKYTVIYEDNSMKLELRSIDNKGLMEYKVTNLIAQDLKMNNNVPIAELTISNSHIEEIFLSKKNKFAVQKLPPNSSYTKEFKAFLNPVSGEYWKDNHKLILKSPLTRNYIATRLRLKNVMGAKHVSKSKDAGSGSAGGKTYVHILYPLNSEGKQMTGKFYFKDAKKHLMHRGQVYRVELSEMGLTKWVTFHTDYKGHTYPPNKIEKWLGVKPGMMKYYLTSIVAAPGESYFFVMIGGQLQSVTETAWNIYLKDAEMTSNATPEEIKVE
jgi:hypothetical protein